MNLVLANLISILVLVVTLLIFAFTPFVKPKVRKVISIVIGLFLIVMVFVPSSILSDISLPFINSSISEFTKQFLLKNEMFTDILGFDPTIDDKITSLILGVVKMCFVYIFLAAILFVSNLILYLIHLITSRKKMIRASLSFIFIFIMSISFVMIPVYSIVNINYSLNTVLTKNKSFVETYPEYGEYEEVFSILDKGNGLIESELDLSEVFIVCAGLYSENSYNDLIGELNSIDSITYLAKRSGVYILYTDKEFDFSKTKKDTFDFETIKLIISNVLKSKIYDDMARLYTNQILAKLEEELYKKENKSSKLELEMNEEKFKEEYVGLIDLLKFVADYDLANRLSSFNFSHMANLVSELDSDALNTLANLSTYPLINKIKDYLQTTTTIASIYTCLVLYDALNTWYEEYKTTDLYLSIEQFLLIKGELSYES